MFKQIFICPRCGETENAEPVEMIDTDRDEVWTEMICDCGASVSPKLIDGKACYRAMTEEEMELEMLRASKTEF